MAHPANAPQSHSSGGAPDSFRLPHDVRCSTRGERCILAQVVVRTTALSVATLPVALFALMGTRYYFAAPLFVLGAALTVIVAVTLLVVAFAR